MSEYVVFWVPIFIFNLYFRSKDPEEKKYGSGSTTLEMEWFFNRREIKLSAIQNMRFSCLNKFWELQTRKKIKLRIRIDNTTILAIKNPMIFLFNLYLRITGPENKYPDPQHWKWNDIFWTAAKKKLSAKENPIFSC